VLWMQFAQTGVSVLPAPLPFFVSVDSKCS
jgi:hypothetical protein